MPESDLTAYARIRNAALELFATRGAGSTSIRDVARHAGVSHGLVQHHFGTKAALREALDEHVLAVAVSLVQDVPPDGSSKDPFADFGDRIKAAARDEPMTMLYAARSASDGDEGGLQVFKLLTDLARERLWQMADAGLISPKIDIDWAALHLVIVNLGTLAFEPAITQTLGEPLLEEAPLERWKVATTGLFRRGFGRGKRR